MEIVGYLRADSGEEEEEESRKNCFPEESYNALSKASQVTKSAKQKAQKVFYQAAGP